MRYTTTLFLLTLLAAGAAVAWHPAVPNGTFDDDINGWEIPNRPDVVVAWDAFGNPGGSLRLTTTSSDPNDRIEVRSACITGPEGLYISEADTYHPAADLICQIEIRGWSGPECDGIFTSAVFPDLPTPGTWSTTTYGNILGQGSPSNSLQVSLTVYPLGPGPKSCYFDNVTLVGPTPTLDIPTVGPAGAGALSLALAGLGLFLVGRRSRAG
jgi:hypothetical protein